MTRAGREVTDFISIMTHRSLRLKEEMRENLQEISLFSSKQILENGWFEKYCILHVEVGINFYCYQFEPIRGMGWESLIFVN